MQERAEGQEGMLERGAKPMQRDGCGENADEEGRQADSQPARQDCVD